MRFYLISDNSDAMNGLRLAGIEGTVARSEADLRAALAAVAQQPDIGMVLVTEKIARRLHRCARPRARGPERPAAGHGAVHRRFGRRQGPHHALYP